MEPDFQLQEAAAPGMRIELIEIDRVRKCLERFGQRFLKRVFSEQERTYAQLHADPAPPLAARFAAKEAGAKALGRTRGAVGVWRDLQVERDAAGRPALLVTGRALDTAHASQARLFVSLTHTRQYAAACVMVAE